jgi:hypothetical protein
VFVLRPPVWQRVISAVALAATAAVLVLGGLGEGGWILPPALVGAAVMLAVTVRSWLLRVELDADSLVLVNWLRTVRLPWAEVVRCGQDAEGIWVRRHDGHQLRVSAFQQSARRAFNPPLTDTVNRIEKYRKKRRSAIRRSDR